MRHYQSLMRYETGRCDGNHKTQEKLAPRCTNLWVCRQSAQNPLRAILSEIEIYRSPTNEQSELGFKYREYTCEMGVSLSLLNNS